MSIIQHQLILKTPAIQQPAGILPITFILIPIRLPWLHPGPHIMANGNGVFVTDENGQTFYEGMSGLWCTSLGFSEPELVTAAIDQFKQLPFYHSFAGKTFNPAIDLAEILTKAPPAAGGAAMSKVFLQHRVQKQTTPRCRWSGITMRRAGIQKSVRLSVAAKPIMG